MERLRNATETSVRIVNVPAQIRTYDIWDASQALLLVHTCSFYCCMPSVSMKLDQKQSKLWSTKLSNIMFKNLTITSKKSHPVSVIKISRLTVLRRTVGDYSENQIKPMNKICGRSAELLKVKVSCSLHVVTTLVWRVTECWKRKLIYHDSLVLEPDQNTRSYITIYIKTSSLLRNNLWFLDLESYSMKSANVQLLNMWDNLSQNTSQRSERV
jgi:hypothetical protein